MRSFHLFVNPASGSGSATVAGVAVARQLRAAGAQVALTHSTGKAECQQLVADAIGHGTIPVAVGGDGMLSSMAGAVVHAGGTMGIVAGGRGNDFARQLGLPTESEHAGRVLLEGTPRTVDVIDAGSTIVVGSVYAGVDSLSSQIADNARFMPRGMQYPYAAMRALATFKPSTYTITVDGIVHTYDAFTTVVANSGYYGSGMHIAPAATVDDGVLDVIIIKAASRYRLMRFMPKLYDGSHVDTDAVVVLTGREVSIEASGPVAAYGDGEYITALPVTAKALPKALNILC